MVKKKAKTFKVIDPRKCENCKHYEKVQFFDDFGECTLLAREELGDEGFLTKQFFIEFYVGKNFCCKHWEKRACTKSA
jgi:hypothetical protein